MQAYAADMQTDIEVDVHIDTICKFSLLGLFFFNSFLEEILFYLSSLAPWKKCKTKLWFSLYFIHGAQLKFSGG